MSDIIQTFWHGAQLSPLEFASLQSFLRHGYTVHIYTYSPLDTIPAGCKIQDANDIIPERDLLFYINSRRPGTLALFADLFRYKLLYERGGWWVDADIICLRRFPAADFCFTIAAGAIINNAVIKVPPNTELMHACYQRALRLGTGVRWGDSGPCLINKLVRRLCPDKYMAPASQFYPIQARKWLTVLDPWYTTAIIDQSRHSYAIHLWNELFRQHDVNKCLRPLKGSYLDRIYSELLPPSSLFTGEMSRADVQQITIVALQRELDHITNSLPWRAYQNLAWQTFRACNTLRSMASMFNKVDGLRYKRWTSPRER